MIKDIVRGDSSPIYRFRVKNNGEYMTEKVYEAYFTVKKDCCDSEVVIQKKLSDGGITYSEEDNYYRFSLQPEDTCSLRYGDYGYDIAVKFSAKDKYTPKNEGMFKIKKHFTHKNNE